MPRRASSVLFVLLIGSTPVVATEEADAPWIRGVYTGKSPRVVRLAESNAWQQAGTIAAHAPDAFVLLGSGCSMQPLYAPGTILVLQKFPYELLERGQTVLYRNRARKVVAHVLVARARDGWRVVGLSNPCHDPEPVSPDNLVGVVIAAFQPVPAPRVQLAALNR